jgi:membrane fusion protein (multidrug efflux system)
MSKSIVTTVLLCLLTAGGGGYWWSIHKGIQTTDNAYLAGDISEISSEIDARIAKVLVNDNEAVHAGDVLAILEDAEFRSSVAQAEASLAGTKFARETADRQIAYQESRIRETMAILTGVQAELDRATAAYERKKKLVTNKIVAVQELEEATAVFLRAAANVHQTTAGLSADRAQLDVLIASRDEANAKVIAAEETLAMARIRLDKTVIRSPIDGVIGDRAARTGQYARAGTHILSVVPNAVYVIANFKETQFQNMRPGQVAHMRVDAFPNTDVTGRI